MGIRSRKTRIRTRQRQEARRRTLKSKVRKILGNAWFAPDNVHRLDITNRRIGHGFFGNIYEGVLFFRDGKSERVAVKFFKMPISDRVAVSYQQIIQDLAAESVPMLRMGMVKGVHPARGEELVQVSQMGDSESVKVGRKIPIRELLAQANSMSKLSQLANLIASFANAGFTAPNDCLHLMQIGRNSVVFPLDLDLLVTQRDAYPKGKSLMDRRLPEEIAMLRKRITPTKLRYFVQEILGRIREPELRKKMEQGFRDRGLLG